MSYRTLFPLGPMDRDPNEEGLGCTTIRMMDPRWVPKYLEEVGA